MVTDDEERSLSSQLGEGTSLFIYNFKKYNYL